MRKIKFSDFQIYLSVPFVLSDSQIDFCLLDTATPFTLSVPLIDP
jgi:hypothetical protein